MRAQPIMMRKAWCLKHLSRCGWRSVRLFAHVWANWKQNDEFQWSSGFLLFHLLLRFDPGSWTVATHVRVALVFFSPVWNHLHRAVCLSLRWFWSQSNGQRRLTVITSGQCWLLVSFICNKAWTSLPIKSLSQKSSPTPDRQYLISIGTCTEVHTFQAFLTQRAERIAVWVTLLLVEQNFRTGCCIKERFWVFYF